MLWGAGTAGLGAEQGGPARWRGGAAGTAGVVLWGAGTAGLGAEQGWTARWRGLCGG